MLTSNLQSNRRTQGVSFADEINRPELEIRHYSQTGCWWSVLLLMVAAAVATFIFYHIAQLTQVFPFGNDNLRLSLPLRRVISEQILLGEFPWWNPYSGGGVPLHTLYISQGLSPIVLVLSLFNLYGPHTLTLEILILNTLSFVGMYCCVRLSCSRLSAYVAAFAYTLTPFIHIQSVLNIEMVGSACALPWLAVGTQLILATQMKGVPIFAAALGLAFTSGYLGINYFFLVFLLLTTVLYLLVRVLIDKFTNSNHVSPITLQQFRQVSWLFVAAFLLFLLIISPLIYETFRNFDKAFFIKRIIDPFLLSMQLESLNSILDTKGTSPFDADQYGGHAGFFFMPSLLLIGVLSTLFRPSTFITSLWIVLCIIFCTALSSEYLFSRLIIAVVPGFSLIRLHSWLQPAIMLLILMIAAHGVDSARSLSGMTWRVFIRVVVFYLSFIVLFLSYQGIDTIDTKYVLRIIGLGSLSAVAGLCLLRATMRPLIRAGCVFGLISIAVCQIYIANLRWDRGALNARLPSPVEQIDALEKYDATRFSAPKAQTTREATSVDSAVPYLFKRPVIDSYMPQRNPAMTDLIERGEQSLLTHYTLTLNGQPITSEALWSTTNTLEINLGQNPVSQPILITIPFSTNWIARSGKHEFSITRSAHNFLQVNIDTPSAQIELIYSTKVSNTLFIISMLTWLAMGIWLIYLSVSSRLVKSSFASTA